MDAGDFRASLDALIEGGRQLPTLPVLVLQVQRALANDRSGPRDIAHLIERDPVLAARVLRLANSAAFSRGDPITTIGAAVGRLGMNHVRSLCLAVGVVRAFGNSYRRLDHQRYWQHSVAVGMVAERLTHMSKRYAQVDGEEAYVAGLLHDVGLLVCDQFFPAEFAAIEEETDRESIGRWRVETTRLGLDHGDIGGQVLSRWQLPAGVMEAVAAHHHPEGSSEKTEALTYMVWGAEALCSSSGLELPQEGIAEVAPTEVMVRLDIPSHLQEQFLADVGGIGERAREMAA